MNNLTKQVRAYREAGQAAALRHYEMEYLESGSIAQSPTVSKGMLDVEKHKKSLDIKRRIEKLKNAHRLNTRKHICLVMAGIYSVKKFTGMNISEMVKKTTIQCDGISADDLAKLITSNKTEQIELQRKIYNEVEKLFTNSDGTDTPLWKKVKLMAEELLEKKITFLWRCKGNNKKLKFIRERVNQ